MRAAGTAGSGARSIVATSEAKSRARWRAVRTTLDSTCWVSAALRVRVPRTPSGSPRWAGWPARRAPVGGVDSGVPQEEEHGEEFGDQVIGQTHRVLQRRRGVNQPTEPGDESAAGRRHTVLAQLSRVAAVVQVEAGLQGRLHPAGPSTVGMILPELPAPSEKMLGVAKAEVRHPSVAHEHAVVGPEHGDGIGEPAAGVDGVDRRVRGDERSEAVAEGSDAPAGFVGRDRRRVAHLLAQLGVGRQQVSQAALRSLQVEVPPQQVGDKLADEGAHLGQVLLILRRHAGHLDRAAAIPAGCGDRCCVGFVDPSRTGAASVPAVLRAGPSTGSLLVAVRPALGEKRRLSAARWSVSRFRRLTSRASSVMRTSRESPLWPGRVQAAASCPSPEPYLGYPPERSGSAQHFDDFSPRPANQRIRGETT